VVKASWLASGQGRTMATVRPGNGQLAAVIERTGWSHAQVARAFVRVALEAGAQQYAGVGRSHVSHWVGGHKPSGEAPTILCETLSRALGAVVTLDEIGLGGNAASFPCGPDWHADTLVDLADLGRAVLDTRRRRVLGAAAYSVAALAVPAGPWWTAMADRSRARRHAGAGLVGRGDVEAVRDMVSMFSRADQRRGGGHARTAVVQYLTTDVAGYLHGRYRDETVRRQMFSAAGELAYLAGWMAFDNAEHGSAQHYFTVAVKLAAEADDPPMAGHVLRAMAHQAIDLGHIQQARRLGEASMNGRRYSHAAPRERALLGVVYARSLAVTGERGAAAAALVRAEDDLAAAAPGDEEPGRAFFFGEASLAHETACALRDTGDLDGALREFRRSVRTRKAATFTRTHAVTLGYLGAMHARKGSIEDACAAWTTALDLMDGVRSGRTRQVARDIRSVLSPFRRRGIHPIADLDARAAAYLARTS
jgi:hypothetical protein